MAFNSTLYIFKVTTAFKTWDNYYHYYQYTHPYRCLNLDQTLETFALDPFAVSLEIVGFKE